MVSVQNRQEMQEEVKILGQIPVNKIRALAKGPETCNQITKIRQNNLTMVAKKVTRAHLGNSRAPVVE